MSAGIWRKVARWYICSTATFDYIGSEKVEGLAVAAMPTFVSVNHRVLRLVTTQWTGDTEDLFRHRLYVLSPAANAPELDLLGVLGEESEARIGKPNEDLYGVRFMGDRAYMVTFERIDPLYVIDLSTPSAPRIVGELEVPGFSDLLHEVTDDLLLGLGSSERGFPKLELYNISDISTDFSRVDRARCRSGLGIQSRTIQSLRLYLSSG